MTASALATLSVWHGVVAWAALAAAAGALLAALLRRSMARVIVPLAAALCAAAFATGVMLHVPFQSKLRQKLFLASATLGWLFERKEHVAFGALALSGCALFALWAERSAARRGDGASAASLRRAGVLALAVALAFEAFSLAVSLAVARRFSF